MLEGAKPVQATAGSVAGGRPSYYSRPICKQCELFHNKCVGIKIDVLEHWKCAKCV